MKDKRILVLIMAFVMIMAAGCGANGQDNGAGDKEESGTMELINETMTEKEKDLLCENFSFDEDRIREGQLSEAQKSALDELRLATGLIDRKYPGLQYEVTSFAPADNLNGQAILDIQLADEGDKEYKAYVIYDESGNPKALETVYGHEVRAAYDEYICSILAENGIEARSYTDFETPVADEVTAASTPEELIGMKGSLVRYTDVFINDTGDRQAAADRIKEIMAERGIYAVYEVDFAGDISTPDIRELEAGRRNFESITFECAE